MEVSEDQKKAALEVIKEIEKEALILSRTAANEWEEFNKKIKLKRTLAGLAMISPFIIGVPVVFIFLYAMGMMWISAVCSSIIFTTLFFWGVFTYPYKTTDVYHQYNGNWTHDAEWIDALSNLSFWARRPLHLWRG